MKKKNIIKAKKLGLTNTDIYKIKQFTEATANKKSDEYNEKTFLYMLAIPLNVLVTEEYWGDEAKKIAPGFIEEVIGLYEAVQDGFVSEEQLAEFLEDMACVKIDAEWLHKKEE